MNAVGISKANEWVFGLLLLPLFLHPHNYWKGPWNSHLYVVMLITHFRIYIRSLWKCFFLYYSWIAFCRKCFSAKAVVLELWIRKITAYNIAWFSKFNIVAFSNNFLVNDVIPWCWNVDRTVKKLLFFIICKFLTYLYFHSGNLSVSFHNLICYS